MTDPTSPQAIAKTLSPMMKAHVQYGIAGATPQTLDALERRGLTHEIERGKWAGHLELSPLGECVRVVLQGYDPANLTDEDRSDLAVQRDGMMAGPAEWQPCDRHPGHGRIGRWFWLVSSDVQCSDAEIIAGCPGCDAEDEDQS